jgi:hypothetical protein
VEKRRQSITMQCDEIAGLSDRLHDGKSRSFKCSAFSCPPSPPPTHPAIFHFGRRQTPALSTSGYREAGWQTGLSGKLRPAFRLPRRSP